MALRSPRDVVWDAQAAGVATPDLLLGIGAALHYNNPEDPQSVAMQQRITELGLKAAVAEFASLEADAPILDQIVEAYSEIETRLA